MAKDNASKSKLQRIAAIKFKKVARIIEHKLNLQRSIHNISKVAGISLTPVIMGFSSDGPVQTENADDNKKVDNIDNTIKTDIENALHVTTLDIIKERNKQEADEKFAEYVKARQAEFSRLAAEQLRSNIAAIKAEIPAGRRRAPAATLRRVLGSEVNSRFYCAYGSIRTLNQVMKENGFEEYNFINEDIQNIHACQSVEDGLGRSPHTIKSRNLKSSVKKYLDEHPDALLIIVHESEGNHTASGKHVAMALKYDNDAYIGSYNGEHWTPADNYFYAKNNSGKLYDISAEASDRLYEAQHDAYTKDYIEKKNLSFQVYNDHEKPVWIEVGKNLPQQEIEMKQVSVNKAVSSRRGRS